MNALSQRQIDDIASGKRNIPREQRFFILIGRTLNLYDHALAGRGLFFVGGKLQKAGFMVRQADEHGADALDRAVNDTQKNA